MPNGMTKETFRSLDQNSKLDTLFDYVVQIDQKAEQAKDRREDDITKRQQHCEEQRSECGDRFQRLERFVYIGIGGVLFLQIVIPSVAVMWG